MVISGKKGRPIKVWESFSDSFKEPETTISSIDDKLCTSGWYHRRVCIPAAVQSFSRRARASAECSFTFIMLGAK
jgi:hypothetical protein